MGVAQPKSIAEIETMAEACISVSEAFFGPLNEYKRIDAKMSMCDFLIALVGVTSESPATPADNPPE